MCESDLDVCCLPFLQVQSEDKICCITWSTPLNRDSHMHFKVCWGILHSSVSSKVTFKVLAHLERKQSGYFGSNGLVQWGLLFLITFMWCSRAPNVWWCLQQGGTQGLVGSTVKQAKEAHCTAPWVIIRQGTVCRASFMDQILYGRVKGLWYHLGVTKLLQVFWKGQCTTTIARVIFFAAELYGARCMHSTDADLGNSVNFWRRLYSKLNRFHEELASTLLPNLSSCSHVRCMTTWFCFLGSMKNFFWQVCCQHVQERMYILFWPQN